MRFNSLVVVTYGRSGSTLIQGLLNACPGTLVRGENNFFMLPLFRSWQRLVQAQGEQLAFDRDRDSTDPWFGIDELSPAQHVRSVSALVEIQLLGREAARPQTLGFKEIRWNELHPDEHHAFLEWIQLVLPNVGFVLHERDLAEVRDSGWWRGTSDEEFQAAIRGVELFQRSIANLRPTISITTQYASLRSKDSEALTDLARWLGVSDPPNVVERWMSVLDVPHSY